MATKKKSSGRKYSKGTGKTVESEMKRYEKGTARSGPGGKGGKVKSRKQAIAIALSEARKEGKKAPPNPNKKSSTKKSSAKKSSTKKSSSKKFGAKKSSAKKSSKKS